MESHTEKIVHADGLLTAGYVQAAVMTRWEQPWEVSQLRLGGNAWRRVWDITESQARAATGAQDYSWRALGALQGPKALGLSAVRECACPALCGYDRENVRVTARSGPSPDVTSPNSNGMLAAIRAVERLCVPRS